MYEQIVGIGPVTALYRGLVEGFGDGTDLCVCVSASKLVGQRLGNSSCSQYPNIRVK